MTEYEIVETLGRNKEVEKMIDNITGGKSYDPTALQDLAQDIYLSLLDKGQKLVEVWEQGHINYYLSRIVCNNIMSSTSPYYFKYIQPAKRSVDFDDRILTIPDE